MAETVVRLDIKHPWEPRMKKPRQFWQDAIRHIIRDRLTLISLIGLIILTAICFIGPIVIDDVLKLDINRTNIADRYQSPNPEHPLGTDNLGRDQLLRLIHGGRVSLQIAYAASILSIAIGVTVGLIAGFYGGIIDDFLIWFINTLESIPAIFLLLIAASTLR